jgi:solute carrier family 25 phosphate transporter 3
MAKFVVFEKVSETILASVNKETLSDGAKTGINWTVELVGIA